MSNLLWFRAISMSDLPQVGGKNASLGEMVSRLHGVGVRVPGGFEHRGGEGGERTLSCPEVQLGLGAGVARGGEEL